jgi:hypothetical protein
MAAPVRFSYLLFVGIALLALAGLIADAAEFITPWPLNMYVFLLAFLLFIFGVFTCVFGLVWSAPAIGRWFRRLRVVDAAPVIIVAALLVYLNVMPRTRTFKGAFSDDPIIVVTHRGWPFPLAAHEHVTEFEDVESHRFGVAPPGSTTKYMRMQKEFSREGFVDRPVGWSVNLLHWFLILLATLIVSYGVRQSGFLRH